MDFFEYQTFFDSYEADGQARGREGAAWLELFSKNVRRQLSPALAERYILKAEAECRWMEDGRQFYAVEPEELVDVTITSLEQDCRLLSLPCPQLEIRFPRPDGFEFENFKIQAIFVTEMLVRGSSGLGILVRLGEAGRSLSELSRSGLLVRLPGIPDARGRSFPVSRIAGRVTPRKPGGLEGLLEGDSLDMFARQR